MEKTKPANEIRLGRVKAIIWKNQSENGSHYSVTLSKLYKKGDSWGTTPSFSRDDLPLVGKVSDLAHSWIYNQPGVWPKRAKARF